MNKIDPYTYVGLHNTDKILFRSLFRNAPIKHFNADIVLNIVCSEFNVNKLELLRKGRSEPIRSVRHIAIYLILEHCKMPLSRVGEIFSGRDHSTIIHSRNYVIDQMDIKKSYQVNIKRLSKLVIDALNTKGE